MNDFTFRQRLVLAAVKGGRSYAWSDALTKHMPVTLNMENYQASLAKIMEAEAVALVAYVDRILELTSKTRCNFCSAYSVSGGVSEHYADCPVLKGGHLGS